MKIYIDCVWKQWRARALILERYQMASCTFRYMLPLKAIQLKHVDIQHLIFFSA